MGPSLPVKTQDGRKGQVRREDEDLIERERAGRAEILCFFVSEAQTPDQAWHCAHRRVRTSTERPRLSSSSLSLPIPALGFEAQPPPGEYTHFFIDRTKKKRERSRALAVRATASFTSRIGQERTNRQPPLPRVLGSTDNYRPPLLRYYRRALSYSPPGLGAREAEERGLGLGGFKKNNLSCRPSLSRLATGPVAAVQYRNQGHNKTLMEQ